MARDQPTVRKGSIVRFRPNMILRQDLHGRLFTVLTHPKMIVIGNQEVLVVSVMSDEGQIYRVGHDNFEVAQEEMNNGEEEK